MESIFALAGQNLSSPIILSFVLGVFAALARSDLSFPEAAAKAMSLYLLFAIGFKGGASVAAYGLSLNLGMAILAGLFLSAVLPFVAFFLLKILTSLDTTNAAAVAGHYGSISIVTFVAGTSILEAQGIASEGFMVAVAAAMEAPAILSALWLVARSKAGQTNGGAQFDRRLLQEILFNGSIVLLVGSFLIGAVTGERGLASIESFIVAPFQGVLCLFLLDMGLVAGRGLRDGGRVLKPGIFVFGVVMPLIGAMIGLALGAAIGLSAGGVALLMVLSASASYIAVPAAMRVALPQADPAIYLTLSLGITFPFNLVIGLPVYVAVAQALLGGSS
ncbi:MAG: sodium-dependent bicarbonate transport family permease [Pseudomonadota bacterium]